MSDIEKVRDQLNRKRKEMRKFVPQQNKPKKKVKPKPDPDSEKPVKEYFNPGKGNWLV